MENLRQSLRHSLSVCLIPSVLSWELVWESCAISQVLLSYWTLSGSRHLKFQRPNTKDTKYCENTHNSYRFSLWSFDTVVWQSHTYQSPNPRLWPCLVWADRMLRCYTVCTVFGDSISSQFNNTRTAPPQQFSHSITWMYSFRVLPIHNIQLRVAHDGGLWENWPPWVDGVHFCVQ